MSMNLINANGLKRNNFTSIEENEGEDQNGTFYHHDSEQIDVQVFLTN